MKTNKTNTLATLITQYTGWRQTKQTHWQPWLHKIQGEDKQNKDTGNLDYTRYGVETNKTKTLATLITQDTGWRQTKQRHWQPWLHKTQGEDKHNKDTGNLDYTKYRVKTNTTQTWTSTKPEWTQEPTIGKHFLLLIRHLTFYSYSQAVLGTSILSSLYQ